LPRVLIKGRLDQQIITVVIIQKEKKIQGTGLFLRLSQLLRVTRLIKAIIKNNVQGLTTCIGIPLILKVPHVSSSKGVCAPSTTMLGLNRVISILSVSSGGTFSLSHFKDSKYKIKTRTRGKVKVKVI
jgi:hypothetical protein